VNSPVSNHASVPDPLAPVSAPSNPVNRKVVSKSQSLERGLNVIELLNASEKPLGPREIARQLALSPAIVQRLLNTLNEKHYVRRDAATKRYQIGYQVLGIGASLLAKDLMLLEAGKTLKALAERMGLDAYLATLQDREAIYLLCIQGKGPINVRTQPGDAILLHSTAIGKAILASFSDAEALELLGKGPMKAFTSKTITDPNILVTALDEVRLKGYAVVDEENIPGIVSIGALIGDPSGQTRSAISIAFSPHVSPEFDVHRIGRDMVAAAQQITNALKAR
jgi:IclR family transcriptional regulator, acetate operon repressor